MTIAKYALLLIYSASIFLSLSVNAENGVDESSSQAQESETSTLMPNYGNWCGLNHPKDINTASDPIDNLDSICKEHDY
jgi:hypothetical protein